MKLRYFFDAGSGICLWSGDDAAREAYGYPVELENLQLSKDIIALGNDLIKRYDASVNWKHPEVSTAWPESESRVFLEDSKKFYLLLSNELTPQFEVIDETNEESF